MEISFLKKRQRGNPEISIPIPEISFSEKGNLGIS